jgi:hypothetical protein
MAVCPQGARKLNSLMLMGAAKRNGCIYKPVFHSCRFKSDILYLVRFCVISADKEE